MVIRVRVALVVLLLGCLGACAAPSSPLPPGVVADPPPAAVAEALRFGVLAPLPPGARIVALQQQDGRDPSMVLAVRMPRAAVEPFLFASGMGPFVPSGSAPGETVFGYWQPDGAPITDTDRPVNTDGLGVYRTASAEAQPDGALLHIWLITT